MIDKDIESAANAKPKDCNDSDIAIIESKSPIVKDAKIQVIDLLKDDEPTCTITVADDEGNIGEEKKDILSLDSKEKENPSDHVQLDDFKLSDNLTLEPKTSLDSEVTKFHWLDLDTFEDEVRRLEREIEEMNQSVNLDIEPVHSPALGQRGRDSQVNTEAPAAATATGQSSGDCQYDKFLQEEQKKQEEDASLEESISRCATTLLAPSPLSALSNSPLVSCSADFMDSLNRLYEEKHEIFKEMASAKLIDACGNEVTTEKILNQPDLNDQSVAERISDDKEVKVHSVDFLARTANSLQKLKQQESDRILALKLQAKEERKMVDEQRRRQQIDTEQRHRTADNTVQTQEQYRAMQDDEETDEAEETMEYDVPTEVKQGNAEVSMRRLSISSPTQQQPSKSSSISDYLATGSSNNTSRTSSEATSADAYPHTRQLLQIAQKAEKETGEKQERLNAFSGFSIIAHSLYICKECTLPLLHKTDKELQKYCIAKPLHIFKEGAQKPAPLEDYRRLAKEKWLHSTGNKTNGGARPKETSSRPAPKALDQGKKKERSYAMEQLRMSLMPAKGNEYNIEAIPNTHLGEFRMHVKFFRSPTHNYVTSLFT